MAQSVLRAGVFGNAMAANVSSDRNDGIPGKLGSQCPESRRDSLSAMGKRYARKSNLLDRASLINGAI
jgi:hypothetical protein